MITDVLRDFFLSRPAITAEFDPDNIQKWPIALDVKDYSILAFREANNSQQTLTDGMPGLDQHSISLVVVSKSPENTLVAAKALENDLVGFVGPISASPEVYCVGIQKVGYSDEYEPDTAAHVGVLSLLFYTRG